MDFLEVPLYSKLRLHSLEYRFPHRRHLVFSTFQLLFRSLLVLITGQSLSLCLITLSLSLSPTASIAVSLPDLEDLISLVGAFSCSALAFVIPPCLEMLTVFPQRRTSRWWLPLFLKDTAIVVMGVVGFVLGTYATLVNIVDYFKKNG